MKRFTTLLVESHGGIARVTLHRPDRRNALDGPMIDELAEAFEQLGQEPEVRVLVLSGSGSVFCAGADLHWLSRHDSLSETQARLDAERLMRLYEAVDRCACPVIGRVQGPAYGGGVGLLAACDVVIAVEGAVFALSEAGLGLVPAVIGPVLLRKAGDSFVRRYCLTAEPFSAELAQRYHLVHDITPRDHLDRRVSELTAAVLRLAPHAARETKRFFRHLRSLGELDQYDVCIEANVRARLSAEACEGLQAFLERRPPRWVSKGTEPFHAVQP